MQQMVAVVPPSSLLHSSAQLNEISTLHLGISTLSVLTQFVEVHAIRFRTRLILHEMRAVFCGAQRRLQSPPVDEDVVHHLNCTQSVV